MKPCDLPAGALALAQCRAIVGGQADPFGRFWDQADRAARKVLLWSAGLDIDHMCSQWGELAGAHRAQIKRRARGLRDYLNGIPLDGEGVAA